MLQKKTEQKGLREQMHFHISGGKRRNHCKLHVHGSGKFLCELNRF